MTTVKLAVTVTRMAGRRREVICHLETDTDGLPEMRVIHELFHAVHEQMFLAHAKPAPSPKED